MIKKSTKNIPIEIIMDKFNFIEDGSLIINYNDIFFLISSKTNESFINFNNELDYILEFNPIMQGDFPTLEVKIDLLQNNIKIDTISKYLSINNITEVKDAYRFFCSKILNFAILFKKDKKIKFFQIENKFKDQFVYNIKNFKIDIEDIIKNTNN